jgi:hypothetical protein
LKIKSNYNKIEKNQFIANKTWNGEYYNISGSYYWLTNEEDELIFLSHLQVDGEGWPVEYSGFYFNPLTGQPIAIFHNYADGKIGIKDAYSTVKIHNDSIAKVTSCLLCLEEGNVRLILNNKNNELTYLSGMLVDMSRGLLQNTKK